MLAHDSGKKYHGKGPKSRAKTSGKEVEEANDDPLVGTDWTPATNDQEAFKDESRRIRKDEKGVQRASRGQASRGQVFYYHI